MTVQSLGHTFGHGIDELSLGPDLVEGVQGDLLLVGVLEVEDVVLDGVRGDLGVIGRIDSERGSTRVAEPRARTELRRTLQALLQGGLPDVRLVDFDVHAVCLAHAFDHGLIGGVVVAFEDVRLGGDADHELDPVVADVLVAHSSDCRVPEVVGIHLVGVNLRSLGDALQTAAHLLRGDDVALLPGDGSVGARTLPALESAEERGLGVTTSRVDVPPCVDVRSRPQQRSRPRGVLHALGVIVEVDGGRPVAEVQRAELDRQCGGDTLSGDGEECNQRPIARLLRVLEQCVDLRLGEDVLLGDRRLVGAGDSDVFTPLAVQLVTEEESCSLPVLSDSSLGEAAIFDVRMGATLEVRQQRGDVSFGLELGEGLVCPLCELPDGVDPVRERVRRLARGRHVVNPASDLPPIDVVVQVVDPVELTVESIGEPAGIVDVCHILGHTSRLVKLYFLLPREVKRVAGPDRSTTRRRNGLQTSADFSGGVCA